MIDDEQKRLEEIEADEESRISSILKDTEDGEITN